MVIEKPFRVLTFDGGGILGYYEAAVLHEISKLSNENFVNDMNPDIGKSFDLICGTSTGSIIAAGLAKGISIQNIKDLYETNAKKIFPNPKPKNKFCFFMWTLCHLLKPTSNQECLKKVMENAFGNMTLKELWETRNIALCIPAVNVQTHKPSVIKTPHLSRLNRDNNMTLSDACLSSASAPIYFPIATIPDPMNCNNENEKTHYIDGGLWANNPILIGLTEALELTEEDVNRPIEIYSIGTPIVSNVNEEFIKNTSKGLLGWKFGIEIIKMSLFAQASGHHYMAQLLAKNLSKIGKKITICRLPNPHLSEKQLSSLDLDKNDSNAFKIMTMLAKSIALDLKSNSNQNNECAKKYFELFTQMNGLK